jgi:anaerobic ribonucleoside-triphosphate reductase activating protein
MKYHNITKLDMNNGDGLRVVLWLSGCDHACAGCQNPITWDFNSGLEFDKTAKEELFEALEPDYISGITFSGGDPLHINNRNEVGKLICEIRNKYPDKTIWIYTGYIWEEVSELDFVKMADILVDGKFIKELLDSNAHWIGSTNQRIIDIKKTIVSGEIVLHNE